MSERGGHDQRAFDAARRRAEGADADRANLRREPRRPSSKPPATPRPEAPQISAQLDEAIRKKVRSLPGMLTYSEMIRRNKRHSVYLIIAMILLAVLLGVAIGSATALYADGGGAYGAAARTGTILAGGAIVGGIIGLLLASGGAMWSWFGGANAILRMSHAKPISKEMDPELYNVVEEMSIAAGIPMPKVYVIGDSAMNAFATGRDPEHGVVAITVGLRQKLTRDELQGVIAHEIAHIRHFDIRFAMLMATMVGIIAVATDAFLRVTWYSGAGGRSMRGRGGRQGGGAAALVMVVVALLLAILAPIAARVIQMTYSRRREYLADAGAVELTRNPQGLANALRRLAGDTDPLVDTANRGTAHMYIVNPLNRMRRHPHEKVSLFSSHPPIAERIARLEALLR